LVDLNNLLAYLAKVDISTLIKELPQIKPLQNSPDQSVSQLLIVMCKPQLQKVAHFLQTHFGNVKVNIKFQHDLDECLVGGLLQISASFQ